jgi:parallel beta-helix repeat protein
MHHSLARLVLALSGAALTFAATGCGDGRPAGCDHYVLPSVDDDDTVREAIVLLEDEQTFCFGPGTYHFTDELAFSMLDGVTVRGTGTTPADVVLDFARQEAGAKGLNFTAMDDLTVENMTVLDAAADNIFVTTSIGLTLRDLVSGWMTRPMNARGRYAIYPVSSTNVLVDNVEAFGSSDAGIYVGQATNCIVRNSLAYGNVAGIEIENSINCEVVDSEARDNTGGILVFELPGLPTHGFGTRIANNTITNNNLANFAEEGTIVSLLPAGTGLMLLAANDVDIADNTITGNVTTGALIISYDTAAAAGAPSTSDPGYDTETESIWVHGNTFTDNGTLPDPDHDAVRLIVSTGMVDELEDLIWDGDFAEGDDAMTLCIEGTASFRNIDAAGGFSTPNTIRTPHDCTGTARAAVVFE